jgi:NitT/TauT family transport system substrate-binding protein
MWTRSTGSPELNRALGRLAGGLCCALVLAGCGAGTTSPASVAAKPPASPSSSAAIAPVASSAAAKPSSSLAAAKVRISYSQISGNEIPLWLASETGILQKHGLDASLELVEGNKGIASLLSGEVQFADIGGSQTLSAAAGGADLAIIGVIAPVYPFVFLAPASIQSATDLKGKTIGVSTLGDSSDTATRLVLKQAGLDPAKDVTIVATGSPQNRGAALISGAIQGGMISPPDNLALEAQGLHEISALSAIKLPAATQGETVQRSYVQAHRDVAQAFMDSLIEAVALAKTDRTSTINVMKKYYKSSDDNAMAAAYDFYTKTVLPSLPFPKPEQFTDAQTVLGATNEQARQFDVKKLLDPSFVQDAANRGLGKS